MALGGGGSGQNMQNTLKNNNRMLKKPSYYEVYKRKYNEAGINPTTIKKATPEQLEAVREKLKASQRTDRIKRLVVLGISLLVTAGIVAYIILATTKIAERSEHMDSIMEGHQERLME